MAFKDATSNAKETAGTIELTPGAATDDGDFMVAVIVVRGPNVTPNTITPPDGWATVEPAFFESGSPSLNVGVYRRIADAEGAEYVWTFGTENESAGALITRDDVDPDAPILVSAISGQDAGSTTRTTPTVDVDEAGCVAVSYFADRSGSSWVGEDVERVEVKVPAATSASLLVCDSDGPVPTGETSRTATASASTSVAVQGIIILRPAPEPPPVFPDAPLKVDVEMRVGDSWEHITADVHTDDPITIERGRADEAAEVAPSKLSLTLRNTAGKYSPRNPRSPYYGLIGRNTPIRVRVDHPDLPAADPYAYMPGIFANYLATPDASVLDVADLDVRMDITPDSWRSSTGQLLASRFDPEDDQQSWMFVRRSVGELRLLWSPDGTSTARLAVNSTAAVPADSGRLAVRVTLDVDNGAGGYTVTFYTAPTIAGPWTVLGDPVVGAGTTGVHAGTAALMIGAAFDGGTAFSDLHHLHGQLHDFQLADGSGTVVADPGISGQPDVIGTEWDGADGLPWTAYGSARILTGGPASRFHGEVSEWPPHWSLGGHRQTIPIEASGIKRRLGQGAPPVQSPLRRSIPTDPRVVAYWPMEDSGGRMASGIPGGPAMLATPGITYAADGEFVASAPLPHFAGGVLTGAVPPYSVPTLSTHVVMMLLHIPDSVDSARRLAMLTTTGTASRWDLWYTPTGGGRFGVTAYSREGDKLTETGFDLAPQGRLLRVEWHLSQRTTGIDYNVGYIEQGGGEDSWTSVGSGLVSADTVGKVRTVTIGDPVGLDDTTIGHVALYNDLQLVLDLVDQFEGYPGETAAARLARLCDENRVPIQIVGQLADTAPMGPQHVDTLLNLLEECGTADGGILGEARDEAGFLYRSRASLYNQPSALELAYGEPGLAAPFEPTDDDQTLRNQIKVTRTGGSSTEVALDVGPLSTAAPPDGVGVYDDSVEVNVETDEQAANGAGWLLHLGTVDEARYPALGVKLHKARALIPAAAGMDFGDRATVANMPVWLPPAPADGIVQGYAETIELLRWRIDCNATPARPWRVWQIETEGFDRIDTAGSDLAAAVDADDTALSVATTDGPIWTTDPADLPLTLAVGGEEMTVTAITGTASPQTFTVVRAANGVVKAHAAGAAVSIADPVVIAL